MPGPNSVRRLMGCWSHGGWPLPRWLPRPVPLPFAPLVFWRRACVWGVAMGRLWAPAVRLPGTKFGGVDVAIAEGGFRLAVSEDWEFVPPDPGPPPASVDGSIWPPSEGSMPLYISCSSCSAAVTTI